MLVLFFFSLGDSQGWILIFGDRMGKWNFTSSLRPKVQTCCHFLTKKTVGSDSGGVKGILFNQENLVGLDLDMLALRKKAVRFFYQQK